MPLTKSVRSLDIIPHFIVQVPTTHRKQLNLKKKNLFSLLRYTINHKKIVYRQKDEMGWVFGDERVYFQDLTPHFV